MVKVGGDEFACTVGLAVAAPLVRDIMEYYFFGES
jgi:hypothetical protein